MRGARTLAPPGGVWSEAAYPLGRDPAETRRAEHAAGRREALRALGRLGVPAEQRLVAGDPGGPPRFPPGVIGSISHDRGLVAVAVTRSGAGAAALGIDLHSPRDLAAREATYIAGGRELDAATDAVGASVAPHLVFALKESLFKARSARDGSWLEFVDIELAVRRDGGADLRAPQWPGAVLRWRWSGGRIRALALLPEEDAGGRRTAGRPEGRSDHRDSPGDARPSGSGQTP